MSGYTYSVQVRASMDASVAELERAINMNMQSNIKGCNDEILDALRTTLSLALAKAKLGGSK